MTGVRVLHVHAMQVWERSRLNASYGNEMSTTQVGS
jgi:hypothetical protein